MDLKIYFANAEKLEDDGLFKRVYGVMPQYRKDKADRLRFAKDKRLSLAAGASLLLAMREAGVPQSAAIAYGEHGKPYFPEYPSFCVSLSHSGEWAMCAAADVCVGCDIEKIEGRSERVANRFFTGEENAYIASFCDDEEMRAAFFRVWTLRESYMKASGKGFSTPQSSFSVIKGGIICADAGEYVLAEIPAPEGYASSCAVCCAGKELNISAAYIDFDGFVNNSMLK